MIQGGEDAYDSDALSCRSEVSFSKGATTNTYRTLRLLRETTLNDVVSYGSSPPCACAYVYVYACVFVCVCVLACVFEFQYVRRPVNDHAHMRA